MNPTWTYILSIDPTDRIPPEPITFSSARWMPNGTAGRSSSFIRPCVKKGIKIGHQTYETLRNRILNWILKSTRDDEAISGPKKLRAKPRFHISTNPSKRAFKRSIFGLVLISELKCGFYMHHGAKNKSICMRIYMWSYACRWMQNFIRIKSAPKSTSIGTYRSRCCITLMWDKIGT